MHSASSSGRKQNERKHKVQRTKWKRTRKLNQILATTDMVARRRAPLIYCPSSTQSCHSPQWPWILLLLASWELGEITANLKARTECKYPYPLTGTGKYSATLTNMKLVHRLLMGTARRGLGGPQPVQAPPGCIKCISPSTNGQFTNHRCYTMVRCFRVLICPWLKG